MGQIADIRTDLLTELSGLSTVDAGKVFGAATAVTTGYPYLTLEWLNETEEDADEVNKWQVFRYRIRIYANLDKTGDGPEWAEETIIAVMDELKDTLNADPTLGDTVDNMEWESIETGYSPFEAGEARAIDAVLKVFLLKKVS